ncbi:MAG: uridine kinase [Methylotenera sp.]|nr:uridine kinase [Oligoflexia bacterium]
MEKKTTCHIIGIAGGSGSGKTTFTKQLHKTLGESISMALAQDHYYIDQSARFKSDGEDVNFDHPGAIDFALLHEHLLLLKAGKSIEVPIYDFATHKRLIKTTRLLPPPVLLLDGTLILSQPGIRDCLSESFFIDTPEEVRYERRLSRDVAERGRKPEGVQKQFLKQVKPMHDLFVEPSKAFATQIVSGNLSFDVPVSEWARKHL